MIPATSRTAAGLTFDQRLLEMMPVAVYVCDAAGAICQYNQRAVQLWGREPQSERTEERFYRSLGVWSTGASHDGSLTPLARALQSGDPQHDQELLLERLDGSRMVVLVNVDPIFNEAGQIIGAISALQDITRRKGVEESAGRLAAIINSSGDAIIGKTLDGIVTSWNSGAEQLFGYTAEEIVGRSISQLLSPDQPNELVQILERIHRGERIDHYETVRVRRDGKRIAVSLRISPVRDASGQVIGASQIARDVTEQRRSDSRRHARLAVTQILAEATCLEAAVPRLLEAICTGLGWDVGCFWKIDAVTETLVCAGHWIAPPLQLDRFLAATYNVRFSPGQGFPGQLWAERQPLWICDMASQPQLPRAYMAAHEGLHGGFGCPVVLGSSMLGVFEFYSRELREPDPDILEMITTICGQLGQFLERRAAEERVLRNERELADFFENAPIALHWMGSNGEILRANQAELDLLGWTRDQYLGRNFAEFAVCQEELERVLQRLREGEVLRDIEVQLRCHDGSIKHVLFDANALWEDGRLVHTRCFMRDITDRRLTDNKLRLYREIFANCNDGIGIIDRSGYYIEQNAAHRLLTNYDNDELIGKTPAIHLGQPMFEQIAAGLQATGTWRGEVYSRNKLGWQTPVELSAFTVKDETGAPLCYVGIKRDITERKKAMEALRASEQRFRALVEQSPVVIQIFAPDGRALQANRAWEQLWHSKREQLKGYNILEDPQLAAKGALPYIRRAFAGEAVSIPPVLYDPSEIDRVGRPRWVEAFFYPVKDEREQLREIVLMLRDVTDRVHAEEALRESEERFRRIVETANEGIWLVDAQARTTFANHRMAAMLGCQPQEVLGRTVFEFVFDEDLPAARERIRENVIGKPEQFDFRFRRQDGSEILVLACTSPVTDPNGRVVGALGMFSDITDRKRAEEALREADRRKDEFLATLAHELRNPLAPIRHAVQLMGMTTSDPERLAHLQEIMEGQVKHIIRLVDDLLDVSRISRGKIMLRKQPIELKRIVERAIEATRPLIDEGGLQLEIEASDEPLTVHGDVTRLTQVVNNLLNNAAKYTPRGGTIRLATRRERHQAVITVRDTGIGIPSDQLSHIFEMFAQVDHSLERSQSGLGIGLTLVKSLVEMHGGTITAASEGLGRGSEFLLRLPLLKGRDPQTGMDASAVQDQPGPHFRILLVEDAQPVATIFAMLLRQMGHEVQVAHDGQSAMEMIDEYQPNVLFSDISMPGMSGYELARRLRQQAYPAPRILVAMTGFGQTEDRERALQAGFDYHLVKPAAIDDLQKLFASIEARLAEDA